jgi:hypothetical protein
LIAAEPLARAAKIDGMTNRDIHPEFAATRLRALLREDAELRHDDPALWWFVRIVTWAIHPWACFRLWWMGR